MAYFIRLSFDKRPHDIKKGATPLVKDVGIRPLFEDA